MQIEITCPGPMSKADVEAKCEQLPQLPQGNVLGAASCGSQEGRRRVSPQSDTLNRAILDEFTQPGFRLKRFRIG